jgi:predicted O-methyltransferase YrrM
VGVINMLVDEGALVAADADRGPTRGWADPVEHARMLHDDRRTGDYVEALAEAVRPGDVVLDIGTRSGVLAIAAARAGARRVYAVEASDIAEVAERVFATNGVQDKVTLIPGWSRHIELPEPADLLVSDQRSSATNRSKRRFSRPRWMLDAVCSSPEPGSSHTR